jgi:hypothetical protein
MRVYCYVHPPDVRKGGERRFPELHVCDAFPWTLCRQRGGGARDGLTLQTSPRTYVVASAILADMKSVAVNCGIADRRLHDQQLALSFTALYALLFCLLRLTQVNILHFNVNNVNLYKCGIT